MGSRTIWAGFGLMALWAYLLYGLGNATPYLRSDLHLTAFEGGLHGSALAVGVLLAGVTTDWLGRRLGGSRLMDLAVLILVAGVGMVIAAQSAAVSLSGALLMGLGGGTLGTQVNVELTRDAAQSRRLLSLVNGGCMVTAATAPLAIGLAAQYLNEWRPALLLPVAGFVAISVLRPRAARAQAAFDAPRKPLPRGYWVGWLFLVATISVEFSIVFWGSTVISTRTGAPAGEASVLASLFVAGMFAGRMAVARGAGAGREPRALLVAGSLVVVAGVALVLASPVPALSGVGLLLCGLGTGPMYPVGLAMAMACAPGAQLQAAARATLASGVAVLAAPSALGLASDQWGVMAAWPLVAVVALAGIVVLAFAHRRSGGGTGAC